MAPIAICLQNTIKFLMKKKSNLTCETISNKIFKKYEIESPLIDNYSTLNSLFSFEKNLKNSYFYSSIEPLRT